jgi:hypothetical protein
MLVAILSGTTVFAQSTAKPLLGVTYIDVQNVELSQSEITTMVRMETEKIGKFEVVDRYEIDNFYKTNSIEKTNCVSKTCVIKAGKELKLDFVVSGTVEKIGRMLAISFRQYNVKTEAMEASVVKNYIYQPLEMTTLLRFAVQSLFGDTSVTELEKLYLFEKQESDLVEKPNVRKLNLSGPRFGVSMLTGQNANIFKYSKSDGGFDGMPFLTQFGYHTEARYINTGSVMALVEFVGLVGGMDQQKFIPSFSVVNGFRFKKSKFEFGFGPMFTVQRKADGFYRDGAWHLESDLKYGESEKIVERLDSRGAPRLTSNWIFAVGRTFTSGSLNMPVNIYAIPNKEGWQFGVSMGWSVEKSKK